MEKQARRGIGAIEIIIIVAIALGIAGLVWYALKGKSSSSLEVPEPPKTGATLFSQGTTKVSVVHPKEWEVTTTKLEEEGWTSKKTLIKSPKGHYMQIFNSSGVGGTCEPDNYEYTLVKKIETTSPDIYFTEYKTDKPGFTQALMVEDFKNRPSKNTTQKEGDKGVDVCSISSYSRIGDSAENSVFITLSSKDKVDLAGDLKYSDIQDDKEFIAMLESLFVNK